MSLRLVSPLAPIAYRLALFALGALFIYAALLKIGAPQDFADAIASYHLLPDTIVNPVALGLPLFELTCGIFLLTPQHRTTALLSIIGLLGIFLAALLWAAIRKLPVNCGCFGVAAFFDASPSLAMARDLGLLLCAVFAYRHEATRDSSAPNQTHLNTCEIKTPPGQGEAGNASRSHCGKKVASRDGV